MLSSRICLKVRKRRLEGRFLFLLFLCLAIGHSVEARQTEAGLPRIGASISPEVRQYFGMFPSEREFLFASISADESGRIHFEIVSAGGTEHMVLTPEQAAALREYLEDYEQSIQERGSIEISPLLQGIVRPRIPFHGGTRIRLDLMDGSRATGFLLYADEHSITVSSDSEPLNWRATSEATTLEIADLRKVQFGSSFGYNLEGDVGAYRQVLLPVIKKRAIYHEVPPPELASHLDNRTAGKVAEGSEFDSSSRYDVWPEGVGWPLGISFSTSITRANVLPMEVYHEAVVRPERGEVSYPPYTMALSADWSLTKAFRIRGGLDGSFRSGGTGATSGDSWTALGGTLLMERSLFRILRRSEFILEPRVSLGTAVTSFSVHSKLARNPTNFATIEQSFLRIGVAGGAGAAVMLTGTLSVQARYQFALYPREIHLEGFQIRSESGLRTLVRVDERQFRLRMQSLSLGLSLRIRS